MAERRMLAKTIIESDFFSNLPVESQMLYVRMNMAADDDGFVSNPRTIMRMYGFSEDSMKLLIAKKFVLAFEVGDDFVFLIKHWKIHNYIQRDRYKASSFRELLRSVYLDENKAYSLTPGEGKRPALPPLDTDCIHDVSKMDTQVRIGKSKDRGRLGEDNNISSLSFEEEKQEKEESPERRARKKHFVELLKFAEQYGYDKEGTYRLAENEGISREELDAARKEASA